MLPCHPGIWLLILGIIGWGGDKISERYLAPSSPLLGRLIDPIIFLGDTGIYSTVTVWLGLDRKEWKFSLGYQYHYPFFFFSFFPSL